MKETDESQPGERQSDVRQPDERDPGLSVLEVVSSVIAAAFGVQSNRNRARDFSRGSARQFIVVGLLATALFVLAIYGVVRLILHLAAG